MISNHRSFIDWPARRSQSLCNESCQNILYKTVFEHFKELSAVAVLLLASKSFQNSSFGANFLVNFIVDGSSILLFKVLLPPSSCLSLQFSPSLHIASAGVIVDNVERSICDYATELISTKYLHLQLRSLTLESFKSPAVCSFLRKATSLPRLLELRLSACRLDDIALAVVAKTAVHVSNLSMSHSSGITSTGMQRISKLSGITCLDLTLCTRVLDSGVAHFSSLSNIRTLKVSWNEITDVGLEHISKFSSLTALDVYKCIEVTDASLEHIASNLSALRSIDLAYCERVSNVGLQHIAKLANMTNINLTRCDLITDAGLRHIAASLAGSMSHLDLTGCSKITDIGLLFVSELTHLATLHLSWCVLITDGGLAHIAKLGNLTKLNVSSCQKLTNAGLEHLGQLTSLKWLDLGYCSVSDAGFVHLAKLSNMSWLGLTCCGISDISLEIIAATMPGINSLSLYGCKEITSEGKMKFKAACPDTTFRD